jgi:hypothetical protein
MIRPIIWQQNARMEQFVNSMPWLIGLVTALRRSKPFAAV